MSINNRKKRRAIRHRRIRKRIAGTSAEPRMSVCCTNKNVHIQFIDDLNGKTLAAASSMEAEFRKQLNGKRPDVEQSKMVAEKAAERARNNNIGKAVLDRGGFKYHGRVKAMADTVRESGIEL